MIDSDGIVVAFSSSRHFTVIADWHCSNWSLGNSKENPTYYIGIPVPGQLLFYSVAAREWPKLRFKFKSSTYDKLVLQTPWKYWQKQMAKKKEILIKETETKTQIDISKFHLTQNPFTTL